MTLPEAPRRAVEERLCAVADERGLALIGFARRLVATPSLPGEEQAVAAMLAEELSALGYRDVEVDEAGNVVGWLGSGPARLMFNGHLDHVPPAGMTDPYDPRLEYRGDELVLRGRGSCDMKANVAAAAYSAAFLDATSPLTGSYLFTADVQEEIDSPLGVPALLARGLRADFAISGESTELAVSLGHRGKAQFDVTVAGRASHASTPGAGINAVFAAVPLLVALDEAGGALAGDDLFGAGSMTVTGIRSEPEGDVAVVPSACVIRVDRRYVPGESGATCLDQLERLVADVSRRERIEVSVRLVSDYPLMSIAPEDRLVEIGREAVESVTGTRPPVTTWRFGVNATFISAAGVPTIGIGPGSEDWAHTSEEHIPVGQLVDSSRIYAALITRLCT